jgi:ankyrin repeat protein
MFLTDTDVLNLMLENEKQIIDIDESDKRGLTALHLAIMKSNVTSVRFLLARGANPNVVDKCGHTPLHVAVVLAKNMDIVKLLLNQNDANVNYLDNNGFDALRFTKYNKYGLTEIREIGDFDINCREENGWTPLHFAMIPINVETARYLLEKGADPTIGDNEGTTPFHLAAALSRETDILGLFLANNKQFDIDHRDKTETTALHMAVKQSNYYSITKAPMSTI